MKASELNHLVSAVLNTPIGPLRVVAAPGGVRRVEFLSKAPAAERGPKAATPAARQARRHLALATRQLREYFAGRRQSFDLPLELKGTDYQKRVWHALVRIPFGRTLSYGELALRLRSGRAGRLGRPAGARAVGRACATNPVPVVVPCHRVVGGDGSLHGFGGGLWRKRALLDLERGN